MFDPVRCVNRGHVPQGQPGNIVGFSPNLVDVKFQHGIFKFLPEELELLDLKNGLGRKQEVVATASKSPHVAQPAHSSVWTHRPHVVHENHDAKVACPRGQAAKALDGACNRPAKSQRSSEPAASSATRTASRADNQMGPRSVQAASPDAGASFPETPLNSTLYHGWVTWSRGSMAWLNCDALAASYPGRYIFGRRFDIFIHKNDCNVMPKQYDRVSFRLTLDPGGNPKGIQATVEAEPEMIPYAEYKRDKLQCRRNR